MSQFDDYREFLKDAIRLRTDFSQSDQYNGVPMPPIQKPYPADATLIELPGPDKWTTIPEIPLLEAIAHRKSHRQFRDEALTMEELSFLLWITQGIRDFDNPRRIFRTVPSAGNRHACETYLAVRDVKGLDTGFYRYLPVEHALLFLFSEDNLAEKVKEAVLGQAFSAAAAVTFIWTAIPYRMEWRYLDVSHKVIAVDAGHLCQNLYLGCEAIDAGTCAIGAYHQEKMDKLLRVDGKEEFTVYIAPVGKKKVIE